MKLVLCLNHFLPDSLAGTEMYTFQLAKSLLSIGVQVMVVIPFFDSEQTNTYNYEGVRVIGYCENSKSDRAMIMGKAIPNGLKEFIDILKNEQPDIVHFQELSAGRGIGMHHVKAVAAQGINILLTCHLSTYSCQTGNLLFKEEKLCDGIIRTHRCTACAYHTRHITGTRATALQGIAKLMYAGGIDASKWNSSLGTALGFPFVVNKKREELLHLSVLCNKIVVLTRWYQRILKSNGVPEEKIHYCSQGLTGSDIDIATRETALPLRAVFVGRISRYKGIHLLIESLKQLPSNKISLHIYGPVTEDEYAQHCVEESKSMANVIWEGAIAPAGVVEMLSGFDLLCLPSTFSEMSPLVIQEAFAAGIPVLASNVYGNAEQVQDGVNGWLFEFKNSSSLKNKLEMLLNDPGLIDAARKNIPVTRGFNEVAMEHLLMYREILEDKAGIEKEKTYK